MLRIKEVSNSNTHPINTLILIHLSLLRSVTFSVCETDGSARARRQEMDTLPLAQSDAMDEEYGKAAATVGDIAGAASYDRVQRNAYYGQSY